MADQVRSPAALGPNAWLVDEMYEHYLEEPTSVSESWQDFFADYRREIDQRPAPPAAPEAPGGTDTSGRAEAERHGGAPKAAPSGARGAPEVPAPRAEPAEQPGEPLRGAAARVVQNMEASLEIPTATSYRDVPAKLLEVNRRVINGYLERTDRGKVSFTHIIGYAVVRAVAGRVPRMSSTFVRGDDDTPRVIRHEHVGLGLAVDVERPDGGRGLLVPVIRDADTLGFQEFWATYEDLIRRVHGGKLSPDDFAGATMTLTNPGTIGTVQSVPRLMPGQGVIVGVGALDYPATWRGADPAVLAQLGASKVITLSSTYDHRVIQGAESGLFLRRVEELLLGGDGFYDDIFASLGVPYESVGWRGDVAPIDGDQTLLEKQVAVTTLIRVYRVRGHLIADLDPLRWTEPRMHPELDPATYGLTIWDLDREFLTGDLVVDRDRMPLSEILRVLRDAYCRTAGIEYMHIQELDEQHWIQSQVEGASTELEIEDQRHILDRLNAAEAFEKFLSTKWLGQKRYGLEGSESLIPVLDTILEAAADDGLDEAVMGMAHRGRLNVLANIVGKSYDQIFKDFEGIPDPDAMQGSGDVKYHLGQAGKFQSRRGNEIDIEMAANPSHLEAVDPVVVGMARARQDQIDEPESFSALPILIHGDAAFAGQGVVAETLNMSDIKGYRVGGTIHILINNQIGYTTTPEAARSGFYATDVAKLIQAPILHVNGDDPEACVRVARLAYAYRQRFHQDVVIDIVCYRRYGHNEADDPSYTQPVMYAKIEDHRSVRKLYTESLVKRGQLTLEEAEQALDDFQQRLQHALDETRKAAPPGDKPIPRRESKGVLPPVETGVDRAVLDRIYDGLSAWPDDFTVHPKLRRALGNRDTMVREQGEVDFANAETLAFGSLLVEGIDIRLAGQDSRRGTFSQRHAVLSDYETGKEWTPLAHLQPDQGRFLIYDSLLSEYAALGFEWGYSVANKDALVCWEAQFGDFINAASVVVDQYLVAAEDKWDQTSGLVLLLPHGYDGQGPEHSSARMERFLSLSAGDNIQACNASTAAQYFHLLRRQMHREIRKPLVIFTPKSLLRARPARSKLEDLTRGSFQEVLDDPGAGEARDEVRRVVLCSGKVAHEAMAERDERGAPVAVVRVEQLYPWPGEQLGEVVARYPKARELVWLQEEPANMGACAFARPRLLERFADSHDIRDVSRQESGSPATGSPAIHKQEQEEILAAALHEEAERTGT